MEVSFKLTQDVSVLCSVECRISSAERSASNVAFPDLVSVLVLFNSSDAYSVELYPWTY